VLPSIVYLRYAVIDVFVVAWTLEETEALRQAVRECVEKHRGSKSVNVFRNLPWMEIAEKVPTKTNDQCRRRWFVNTPAVYLCSNADLFLYMLNLGLQINSVSVRINTLND